MNRCPDARALLSGYVEGELSALEHRLVAGHLEICSACRREEAQYRQALGLLNAPREPRRPGDLYTGFAARLARYEAHARRSRLQLRWALGSLACVLFALGASASFLHFRATSVGQRQMAAVHPAPVIGAQQNAQTQQNTQRTSPPTDIAANNAPPVDSTFGSNRDPFDPRGGGLGIAPPSPPKPDKVAAARQDDNREPRRSKIVPKRLVTDDDPRSTRVGGGDVEPAAPKRVSPPRKPVVIVPELNERVRVGNKEFAVRSESGWDANGELAMIRIRAETKQVEDRD